MTPAVEDETAQRQDTDLPALASAQVVQDEHHRQEYGKRPTDEGHGESTVA
jgi:hypothetical protein